MVCRMSFVYDTGFDMEITGLSIPYFIQFHINRGLYPFLAGLVNSHWDGIRDLHSECENGGGGKRK